MLDVACKYLAVDNASTAPPFYHWNALCNFEMSSCCIISLPACSEGSNRLSRESVLGFRYNTRKDTTWRFGIYLRSRLNREMVCLRRRDTRTCVNPLKTISSSRKCLPPILPLHMHNNARGGVFSLSLSLSSRTPERSPAVDIAPALNIRHYIKLCIFPFIIARIIRIM